jgi:16S rRNA C1402 N4-methylase RsmH
MRMDTSSGPTAADLLGEVDERTLADVIVEFGEERLRAADRAGARRGQAGRPHRVDRAPCKRW